MRQTVSKRLPRQLCPPNGPSLFLWYLVQGLRYNLLCPQRHGASLQMIQYILV